MDETTKCQFCGEREGKRFAENYLEAIPPSHLETRIVTLAVCSDCFWHGNQFLPTEAEQREGFDEPYRYTIDDRKILGFAL